MNSGVHIVRHLPLLNFEIGGGDGFDFTKWNFVFWYVTSYCFKLTTPLQLLMTVYIITLWLHIMAETSIFVTKGVLRDWMDTYLQHLRLIKDIQKP